MSYLYMDLPVPSPLVACQLAVLRLTMLRGCTSSPASIMLATLDVGRSVK